MTAALAAVVALAGCGDDASDEPTGGGENTASVLGPEKAATGEPVKIGWISTGQTQANDTRDEIHGAETVARYANARLGGIGGRPIELITCEEKGTPAGAQECANKLIEAGVVAVAGGSSGQADSWVKIVNEADIPVGINFQSTPLVLGSDNVYVFGNPLGAFGTPAAYARAEDLKKTAIVVIDVPAASGAAKAMSPGFFRNAGLEVEVFPVPPGTADMTPQIQAAENGNPDTYSITGDPNFCTGAIRAIRTLGIDKPITALDRCLGTDSSSIPGGYEGVEILAQANINPEDAEYKIYSEVVKTYGEGLEEGSNTVSGYQGMLSLVRALNASGTTDLTAAGIGTALKEMPPTPYPLGGGATFQCNGTAIAAVSKNICFSGGFIASAEADGTLKDFRTIDAEGIYGAAS